MLNRYELKLNCTENVHRGCQISSESVE